MTLGYYLKNQRKRQCLFQDQAAHQIGISRVHYSAMENDRIFSYSPCTLKKVADFLGKDTDWVIKHLPKKN